jgi:hypothetical protein
MYIIEGKNMGKNPASVNLDTGCIEINAALFKGYSEHTRRVILAHEIGHYVNQDADDELLADSFAIEYLAGKSERSLRKSVSGLITALKDCNIPDDRKRNIVITALKIDAEKFGNHKSQKILDEMNNKKANASGGGGGAGAMGLAGAIINFAASFIQTGNLYLWGPKAAWFNSTNKSYTQTAERVETTREATRVIVMTDMQFYAPNGLDFINAQLNDEDVLVSRVAGKLAAENVFRDNNAGTTPPKTNLLVQYEWFKNTVIEEKNNLKKLVEAHMKMLGYDVSSGSSSSSIFTTKNVLIAGGVLAVILIVFRLWR